jgi:hypothetical protein
VMNILPTHFGPTASQLEKFPFIRFSIWFALEQCGNYSLVSTKFSMNISQPVPSAISSVDFGCLSSTDIRKLSVKRVQNPTTFDTLLHPVPGGLYDPALGAWCDIP